MGWNVLKFSGDCALFKGIPDESTFYFVHSYAAGISDEVMGLAFYDLWVPLQPWFKSQLELGSSGEVW